MSTFAFNIAPSGSFFPIENQVPEKLEVPNVPVFNPGVFEDRRDSYTVITRSDHVEHLMGSHKVSRRFEVRPGDLESYSDAAVKLAATLSCRISQCRLAPLNGAARPCALVEVMTGGKVSFEPFDFHSGSVGKRDHEIRRSLRSILHRRNPGGDLYQIQIVDTAIGGHGINKLIALLDAIHDGDAAFAHQYWAVDVHLLYPMNRRANPKKMRDIEFKQKDKFLITLTLYPVRSLLVEDYKDALGFHIESKGNLCSIVPDDIPGKFPLWKDGARVIVESRNVMLTFDELLSEQITDSLLTDPYRRLDQIVWRGQTRADR